MVDITPQRIPGGGFRCPVSHREFGTDRPTPKLLAQLSAACSQHTRRTLAELDFEFGVRGSLGEYASLFAARGTR